MLRALILFVVLLAQDPEEDFDRNSRRAAPRDAFPVLNDPELVPASQAKNLRDDDWVIGVAVGDEAKAYPVGVMGRHELANDTCGGEAIAVSWWPLCQTAIVYRREVEGKTLTFGHEGILYKNSFIMYDKQTNSLWVHTTGEAIKGEMKGKQLDFLPSVVTRWGAWRRKHPGTKVLNGRRARGMMGSYGLDKDPSKYGLSLGQGRKTKLYPFEILMKKKVVNDAVDGKNVVIVFDAKGLYGVAYERGERTFRLSGGKLVDDEKNRYDPWTGEPEKKGDALAPVAATSWYIHRWKPFYPDGEVYR